MSGYYFGIFLIGGIGIGAGALSLVFNRRNQAYSDSLSYQRTKQQYEQIAKEYKLDPASPKLTKYVKQHNLEVELIQKEIDNIDLWLKQNCWYQLCNPRPYFGHRIQEIEEEAQKTVAAQY